VVMRYGENADKVIDVKLKNERSRKDCLGVTFKLLDRAIKASC
jgi:hypothetical protein